jgi:hypothetical protein
MFAMMAQGNHNLDEILRLLSKEVDFRTFVKLKALTNASDSEFLNGQLFEFFRKRQGNIPFTEVLSLPSEAGEPVKSRLLSWLVRWRRLLEPWHGEALHSAIGEIRWGLARGMGEDLSEFITKAMQLAQEEGDIPAMLEILGLERQVVMTYWPTGERRINRLRMIQKQRHSLIKAIEAGEASINLHKTLQAESEEAPRRVRSDLLFRLCKTLSDEECDELRRHIQLQRKDAKQFRLLDYYRQLPEWSREQEKKDWTGENLSKLKSNTLAWLMRNMARYGAWHGKELHHLFGDIKWAISRRIENYLGDHYQRALSIARDFESPEIVMGLLLVGRQHFVWTDQASEMKEWVFKEMEEEEDVHGIRLEYFEPIKIQNKVTGYNHLADWQVFQTLLENPRWETLSSFTAKREILGFRLLAKISFKLWHEAGEIAIAIQALHRSRPNMPAENWARYFEELRVCCFAFVRSGNSKNAQRIIDHIQSIEESDHTVLPHSVLPRLLSIACLYDATSDTNLAEMGLRSFTESRLILKHLEDNQRRIWLLWFVAKAALELGKFSMAKEALNEILDKKTFSPTILIAHSRVRLLLTLLGSKVESEVIYNATNACLVYLKRNQSAPKFLQQIVHVIKRIASFEIGSIEHLSALENAAIEFGNPSFSAITDQGISLNYGAIFERITDVVRRYR